MAIIIDGKKVSAEIQQEIQKEVEQIVANGGRPPHLAAVLVGSDPASETYVASKVKTCEKLGFKSSLVKLPADISEADLLGRIQELNADSGLDGYIIQLPLPKHISEKKVLRAVDPEKDVDGFHAENVGRMALHFKTYLPATPFGIVQLLERYKIETAGKHCVILGRSHIVGSPMSILMSRNDYPGNCTVTLCHSKTPDLKEFTLKADILIVAIGKPEFVTADMVKPGAVVIDVGIHRVKSNDPKGYTIKGDVAFEEVSKKASAITPVPGGVGPMTIVSLLKNTLMANKKEVYS